MNKDEYISRCCHGSVTVEGRTTKHHVCSYCDKTCDVITKGTLRAFNNGCLAVIKRERDFYKTKSAPKKTIFQKSSLESIFHNLMKNMELEMKAIKNKRNPLKP